MAGTRDRNDKTRARVVVAAALFFIGLVWARPIASHLRAMSLLVRFSDAASTSAVAGIGRHAIDESPLALGPESAPLPARLYTPRDAPNAPGVVIVHGMHRLGIEEPRLIRFARAIAESGLVVLTPTVRELSTYEVDARSIDVIGEAAVALEQRMGRPVGVVGLSFAGGLSLLAAADPRYARAVGFVLTVGAHDDLARVLRFFLSDAIPRPDGSIQHLGAHGYGALVLARDQAADLFPASDREGAREAIRLWLGEEYDAARARLASLSPEGHARLDAMLTDHHVDTVTPILLAGIDRDRARLASVSPRGRLEGLEAPVFLLHGAGDTVIPATETLWLAKEVPAPLLRGALVSEALVHVELDKKTTVADEWALVHLMALVLTEADAMHSPR